MISNAIANLNFWCINCYFQVKLFLDHGANVNDDHGEFPLYLAAACKNPATLLTLLKGGANVDMKTIKGRTALHNACMVSNVENIKILLSVGADEFVKDYHGRTPFAYFDFRSNNPMSISNLLMFKTLALKRACLQPSIKSKKLRFIKKLDQKHRNYYQDCRTHISRTKSTRFIETCTFFELMTKCQCQIAVLMRNPEFKIKFKWYDPHVFSMYAEDIIVAFERAEHYHHSILEQEDVINEAFYYALPREIARKVARYILKCEECELKMIVRASRGVHQAIDKSIFNWLEHNEKQVYE